MSGSQRAVPGGDPAEILKGNPALPVHNLVHIIFQGFDGLPVSGSHWFGYIGGYSETAAYVGVIAVVLAVTALAVRRGRPEVLAFGVLCVAMLVIAFVPPVVAVLSRLPLIGTVLWQRGILPLTFGIAVLAGVGLDALVRSSDSRAVRRWAGGGFAAVALVLIVLLLFGRGDLPADEAAIRAKSFIWPAVETAVGLGVVVTLTWMHRRSDSDGGSRLRRVPQPAGWLGSRSWHARRPFSSPPEHPCGRRARRRSRRLRAGRVEECRGLRQWWGLAARCAFCHPASAYLRTRNSRTASRSWRSTTR